MLFAELFNNGANYFMIDIIYFVSIIFSLYFFLILFNLGLHPREDSRANRGWRNIGKHVQICCAMQSREGLKVLCSLSMPVLD